MQRPTSHGVTAIAHGVTYGFYYTYQCADHNVADLDAVEIYHHLFDIHGYRNPRGIHSIITRIENATRAAYIATMIPATPDTTTHSDPIIDNLCIVENAVGEIERAGVVRFLDVQFFTDSETNDVVIGNLPTITIDYLTARLIERGFNARADWHAYHNTARYVCVVNMRTPVCATCGASDTALFNASRPDPQSPFGFWIEDPTRQICQTCNDTEYREHMARIEPLAKREADEFIAEVHAASAPPAPVCEVCGAPTQCYVEFDETPDILHAVCDSCDPNVLRAPEFRTPRPTRSIFNVAINADAITPDALIRQLRSQLSEIADTGAYHDVTENIVPIDQRRGACDSFDCRHSADLTERFFIDPIGMHGAPNVGLLIIHLDCHATLHADLRSNYPIQNARRLLYALDGPCGYGAPIFPPTPQPPTRRQCSECNAPATFTCSICDARICPSHGYSKNIDTDPIVCHACAVNHRCTYDCTHDAYALLTPTPRSQSELNSRYAPSVLPTQKYPDPNTSDCARCGRAIYQGFVGVWYHKSTNEKRCSDLPRDCVATPI